MHNNAPSFNLYVNKLAMLEESPPESSDEAMTTWYDKGHQ